MMALAKLGAKTAGLIGTNSFMTTVRLRMLCLFWIDDGRGQTASPELAVQCVDECEYGQCVGCPNLFQC